MATLIVIDLVTVSQIHLEIVHVLEIQSLAIVHNLPFYLTFASGLLRNQVGLGGAKVLALAVIIPLPWYASDTG